MHFETLIQQDNSIQLLSSKIITFKQLILSQQHQKKSQIINTIDKDLQKYILKNKKQWNLNNGAWQTHKAKDLFSMLQICGVQNLWISGCDNPYIISQIKTVQFSYLREIKLNCNKILSIEGISEIKAPALRGLDLSSNHLVTGSLRSLSKTHFPCLNQLKLLGNPIIDFNQQDSFAKISFQNCRYLYLNYTKSYCTKRNISQCQNLDVVWKINAPNINIFQPKDFSTRYSKIILKKYGKFKKLIQK